eukprot:9374867-Alexandrium_andersonii.AAC.1
MAALPGLEQIADWTLGTCSSQRSQCPVPVCQGLESKLRLNCPSESHTSKARVSVRIRPRFKAH